MNSASELERGKNEWLAEVLRGNSKVVEILYRVYRDEFVQWLKFQTNCTENEALDIFQDSVLALYKNILSRKLTHFEHTIKWYLFGIGKKMYLRNSRNQKLQIFTMENVPDIGELISIPSLRDDARDQQEAFILEVLQRTKEPCFTILYLFYYEKQKISAIAQKLGYKNANIASIQKIRCLKALQKVVLKKFGKKGSD
ncbi:MAG: sigma-70 family RNA polymerase sigma factor [Chitinophagales bacterium]